MKIELKMCGLELHIERPPMSEDRFHWCCYVALAVIAAVAFVGFIALMTR